MTRIALAITSIALVGAAALAGGSSSADAAVRASVAGKNTEALVGFWRWTDRDEILQNRRNPKVVRFAVRGGKATARFGRQRPVAVRWNARRGTFAFTAPRRAGRNGRVRVRVRYSGRVIRARPPRIEGTLRIISRRYPGRSSFSALKSRRR